jgi:hypothetical protein
MNYEYIEFKALTDNLILIKLKYNVSDIHHIEKLMKPHHYLRVYSTQYGTLLSLKTNNYLIFKTDSDEDDYNIFKDTYTGDLQHYITSKHIDDTNEYL